MTFEELDNTFGEYAPFMLSLSDTEDNELTVRLAASAVGEQRELSENDEPNPALRGLLNRSRPLLPETEREYTITFGRYIIYQVGNESFCSGDPNERFRGRFLRVYESSFLLGNISRITDAQVLEDGSYYPAKWSHYKIITLNHIIDVISVGEPVVNIFCGT